MAKTIDYKFGHQLESELFSLFCEKFDAELKMQPKYNVFDYASDKTLVELKSRRCRHNTYPTTMIGANKFEKLVTDNRDAYFVFSFTDGIYYWKYDKDQLNQFELQNCGRYDRGRPEIKPHYLIPINNLEKLI